MEPRRRPLTHLGLRSQIVLALTVTFVLAFGLFSVALVRITQRARAHDRMGDVRAAAELLASDTRRWGEVIQRAKIPLQ